jgi:putative ABC transport system substrate-binding protein
LQTAARVLGVRLLILNASDTSEFEAAFATVARERAGGLVISSDRFFSDRGDQLSALATRHLVPTIYTNREAAAVSGLMSYGTGRGEVLRQNVTYINRILKGEMPADLPVQQVTKIELVINLKTAKALGLTIPETLLATADEVIQ